MSRTKERLATLAAMTLPERLEAVGVTVPHQEWVKTTMEAARRGLPLDTSASEMEHGLFRRIFARFMPSALLGTQWTIYSASEYASVNHGSWGAPMPPTIADSVGLVTARIPDAQVRVHALPNDDPWVEVVLGDESCFIHGWMRTPSVLKIIV